MNRGIRAVELALRLHMLNQQIRPSVSLDLATGYLEVEIYEKLEMDTLDRIYRSKAILDDKEAVNRIITTPVWDTTAITGFMRMETTSTNRNEIPTVSSNVSHR